MRFLRGQVWGDRRSPCSNPLGAAQDTSTHAKVTEILLRWEMYQGCTLIQDVPSGELLLPCKVKG